LATGLSYTESAVDLTRARKRFARIMPVAFVTYGLAYFDRVNYAYGVAGGLSDTVRMSPKTSSLVLALFFVGYTAFQIPGAAYASRHSAKKLIFWALLLWGGLCAAQGLVGSAWMLAVTRTLLGAVESVVFPGMLVFLTHWFTRRQRSRANTVLILGNPITMTTVSLVSGFLIDYFDAHRIGNFRGWQMMFILEGIPSVLWAVVWWFLTDDRPAEARWLTGQEATAVQEQLDAEQKDIPPVRDYRSAFKDARVALLSVMYFGWSIGTYGFVFWLPKTLKESGGLSNSTTGVLAAVPYLLAAVTMVLVSFPADQSLNRKVFIWPAMLIGGVAFFVAAATTRSHFWVAYVAFALAGASVYTPCGPLWAFIADLVPRNVVGESMALVNTAGAVGGFVGSYAVGYLNAYFPSEGAGFVFLGVSMVIAGLVAAAVRTPRKPAATSRA
jgi:sugar phosphate permease